MTADFTFNVIVIFYPSGSCAGFVFQMVTKMRKLCTHSLVHCCCQGLISVNSAVAELLDCFSISVGRLILLFIVKAAHLCLFHYKLPVLLRQQREKWETTVL